MTTKEKKKTTKNKQTKKDAPINSVKHNHDKYFKQMMEYPEIARGFLEYRLNPKFKALVDMSTVKAEKVSFIDDELKSSHSDVIFSVKTKNNSKAYVYSVIVEHMSDIDRLFSVRIWRYIINIFEKHLKETKEKDKDVELPLVYPLILSNAGRPYDAPRNLWPLFGDSEKMGKELLTNDFEVVDLYSMQNDEFARDQAASIMEYMLKHIRDRDLLKALEDLFDSFSELIDADRKYHFIYLSHSLCYIRTMLPKGKQKQLYNLVMEKLSTNDGEEVMQSIADFEREKWKVPWVQEGIEKGIEKGKEEEKHEIVINMLNKNLDVNLIAEVAGKKPNEILKIAKEAKIKFHSK